MKIIIASSNQGKIKEFEQLLPNIDIKPYTHYLEKFEIEETGSSFQENAIIKAKAIYDKLPNKKDIVVISDDSGISVCALNNEPNIYSARYAKPDATDDENNQKLIFKLKEKHLTKTPAYYTASIALIYNNQIFTTHGWMWGDVIDTLKGDGGFGYDPMFIPTGFDKTLGELDPTIKKGISHRTKALNLALKILKLF